MTLIIIAITVLVSVIAFSKEELFYRFQFNPYQVKHSKQAYRFLTHALLHANWLHLAVNMFVLYFFGRVVEGFFVFYFQELGYLYYFLLYVGGVLFSSLTTYKKFMHVPHYNSVGASGAVSAVVFSSILLMPMNDVCLYGVLCLPGVAWGIIYLGYSYYMSRKGGDNINHDAHFTGALFGVLFTIAIKPAFAKEFVAQIIEYFQ